MVLYVKTRGKPSHLTKPSIQCPHNCARAFSFDSVNSGQAISDVLRCRLQDSLAPTYLLRTIHPLINLESGNCIKASSLSLPNARTLTLLSCPRWNSGCSLDTRSTLPHDVARTRSFMRARLSSQCPIRRKSHPRAWEAAKTPALHWCSRQQHSTEETKLVHSGG
jgi:hypothetical protein